MTISVDHPVYEISNLIWVSISIGNPPYEYQFQLKMRTVNFLLIKNLCIVDLVGAVVVLPVPLVATAKGQWDFGEAMCMVNSVVNVALWFQHIVMFAMLKIDRVLASCLPYGTD